MQLSGINYQLSGTIRYDFEGPKFSGAKMLFFEKSIVFTCYAINFKKLQEGFFQPLGLLVLPSLTRDGLLGPKDNLMPILLLNGLGINIDIYSYVLYFNGINVVLK